MRLETIPLILGAIIALLGLGLIVDSRVADRSPGRERRRRMRLERSRNGGETWERASPWLPSTVTQHSMPTPAGPRLYRLLLRGRRGAPVSGPPVSPTP